MKAAPIAAQPDLATDARWIWSPVGRGVNQYVDFVREFSLANPPGTAWLIIMADSDFALWINGAALPLRQFPCYADKPVYDRIEVSAHLKAGRNRIAVLGYHRGVDGHNYRLGEPRLLVQLDAGDFHLVSDASWLCRPDPAYVSGKRPPATLQLGFTVGYDARREDRWFDSSKPIRAGKSSAWQPAEVIATQLADSRDEPRQRPAHVLPDFKTIPAGLLVLGDFVRPPAQPARKAGGRFVLAGEQDDSGSTAALIQSDFLCGTKVPCAAAGPWTIRKSQKAATGAFAIFDLGAPACGTLDMAVAAPAGTVVEVAHGEHLDDLRVRAKIGARNFADRFVCGAGVSRFSTPFRRLGCRYLQVHFHFPGPRGEALVQAIGLQSTVPDRPVLGTFQSPDRLMEEIRAASVRTLSLGMDGAFSDCPWREQSLYAYDCRSSSIFNYYTFGDYDFPAESLRLLGWGLRPDGLLELCAPARIPVTIPTFSLAWVCAVCEHYLFSGSDRLFVEFEPTMERILLAFLAREDKATGLARLFVGDQYWAFYEWAPGLDFKNGETFGDDGKFRLDAPHNLMLIEALDLFAAMRDFQSGSGRRWRQAANQLRLAVRRFFWREKEGAFASFGDRKRKWHFSAMVQAQAIVTGVATPAQARQLLPGLLDHPTWVPMTLSTLWYGLRAMDGRAGPSAQRAAYDHLGRRFGRMLLKGSQTLWETDDGADDFDSAGSLCHPWSAVPLWYSQACLLGVSPLAPGFSRFRVRPHTAAIPHAAGTIPTPHGPIEIAWGPEKEGVGLSVSHPGETSAEMAASLQRLDVVSVRARQVS